MTTAVATTAEPNSEATAPVVPPTPAVETPPNKEASTPAATPAEKPAAATSDKKEAAPAKSQVPEKYEFKAGNGETLDAETAKDFSEFAKSQGLSQESAQAALATAEKLFTAHQTKAYHAAVDKWGEASKADKEIGGDKLQENLSLAEKFIAQFATPGLQKLLAHPSKGGIGWGNHREVIATFANAARRLVPDGFVTGQQAPPVKSAAKAIFDNSNMN